METRLAIAETSNDYRLAAELFREYAVWLNIDLAFQNFDEELQELDEMYGPPSGLILLVFSGEEAIGCAGLRAKDDLRGEIKRMYIKPKYQGHGIGNFLLENLIIAARDKGYHELLLDTLAHMTPAIKLYSKFGFKQTGAYYHNPNAEAVYMHKIL